MTKIIHADLYITSNPHIFSLSYIKSGGFIYPVAHACAYSVFLRHPAKNLVNTRFIEIAQCRKHFRRHILRIFSPVYDTFAFILTAVFAEYARFDSVFPVFRKLFFDFFSRISLENNHLCFRSIVYTPNLSLM
mgnify:CR=1 FL=1